MRVHVLNDETRQFEVTDHYDPFDLDERSCPTVEQTAAILCFANSNPDAVTLIDVPVGFDAPRRILVGIDEQGRVRELFSYWI